MRLHLKQQPPDVHGMITEHKASHSHKSKEDTVTCLIREAMRRFDETDKHEDLMELIEFYKKEIERLRASNDNRRKIIDALKIQNDELKRKEIPAKTFDEAFQRYGI
jgi:predicted RNase H-like nuclease (RuvC/YqgF family)